MEQDMIQPFERKFGWEPHKRIEALRVYAEDSRDYYPLQFREVLERLPVVRIPIELPLYRLKNGRTASLQEEYIAINEGIPRDYFRRDEESIEVQIIQHGLLQKLVKETELDKHFAYTANKQTQPLICTLQGVVVNGNRRLSCWRDLYYDDPVLYGHFKHIDAAILPASDEDSILDLEADLQIAPEMKEDYTWHAEAHMMKQRKDERHET